DREREQGRGVHVPDLPYADDQPDIQPGQLPAACASQPAAGAQAAAGEPRRPAHAGRQGAARALTRPATDLITRSAPAGSAAAGTPRRGSFHLTTGVFVPSLRVAFAGRRRVPPVRHGPQTPSHKDDRTVPARHRLLPVVFFSEPRT